MIDRIGENFADIETEDGESLFLPTQLVGMVATITHSVSQEGGTTNVTFTHVRAHRSAQGSDDEFLNLSIRDSTVATGGFQVSTYLSAESNDFETLEWLTKLAPQRSSGGEMPAPHSGGGGSLQIGHTGPRKGKIVRIETSMVLRDWSPQLVYDISNSEDDETRAERFKSKVYYTSARVIEKVKPTASQKKRLKKIKLKTPVETALMPPWFSPSYYNENIGEKIYQSFFGIGSIVDEQVFQQSTGDGDTELAAMTDFIDASDKVQGPNASDSPSTDKDQGTIQTGAEVNAAGAQVERTISVQQAIDTLSVIYGHLKHAGDLDINGFVRRYTTRPIATMDQVLGTQDFSFDPETGRAVEEEGKVVGVEGFHSRAIADLDQLKGLIDKPGQKLPRLVPSTKQALDPDLDPRPGRQERVENYTKELYGASGSRGLKG
jgi:hypothetical protein